MSAIRQLLRPVSRVSNRTIPQRGCPVARGITEADFKAQKAAIDSATASRAQGVATFKRYNSKRLPVALVTIATGSIFLLNGLKDLLLNNK